LLQKLIFRSWSKGLDQNQGPLFKEDRLGGSVVNAADINGDGFDDLIVGADGTMGRYGGEYLHDSGVAYVILVDHPTFRCGSNPFKT
jgi:hypothetical protein